MSQAEKIEPGHDSWVRVQIGVLDVRRLLDREVAVCLRLLEYPASAQQDRNILTTYKRVFPAALANWIESSFIGGLKSLPMRKKDPSGGIV